MKSNDRDENRDALEAVWSKKMALEKLKEVVEVSIEATRQEIVGKDGEVEIKFNSTAANAATKAIESATRILECLDTPEDEDGEIQVELGELSEFAE